MKYGVLGIFILFGCFSFSQESTVTENNGNLTIEYDGALQKIISEKENVVCEQPEGEDGETSPKKEFCDGTRVQVFYSKNRSEAEEKLKEVKLLFPNLYSNLVYHSPDWKVYVGYFESRDAATPTLNKAKRKFSASFIYHEKFRCSLIKN